MLSLLMGMIKHSQITQSSKFTISLQYVKKEVTNGGDFWHPDKRQSFYKLVLCILKEVARYFQNTQNRKFVVFLQYIKKNCRSCFVFCCNAKHSDILRESSHVRCCLFIVPLQVLSALSKLYVSLQKISNWLVLGALSDRMFILQTFQVQILLKIIFQETVFQRF